MTKPRYTFVASSPRSRSAWLSNFLTQGNYFFWHDPSQYLLQDGIPDYSLFRKLIDSSDSVNKGCVDTGLSFYWDKVKDQFEGCDVQFVYLRRDKVEILRSFCQIGLKMPPFVSLVDRVEAAMDSMESNHPGISLTQADISNAAGLQKLQKETHPDIPFSSIRTEQLLGFNVQIQLANFKIQE